MTDRPPTPPPPDGSDRSDAPDDAVLEALAAELGAVLRVADPVPAGVLAMARQALVWRTIDAELADLVHDSASGALTGVRGPSAPGAPRELSFEGPTRSLDVVVDADGQGGQRVVGQVAPAGPGEVLVHHHDGEVVVVLDEVGRFHLAGLPLGALHLTVAPGPGGAGLRTRWFGR